MPRLSWNREVIVEIVKVTMYDDRNTAEHLADEDCVWEAKQWRHGGDLNAYMLAASEPLIAARVRG